MDYGLRVRLLNLSRSGKRRLGECLEHGAGPFGLNNRHSPVNIIFMINDYLLMSNLNLYKQHLGRPDILTGKRTSHGCCACAGRLEV
jgi:hypothetical protein